LFENLSFFLGGGSATPCAFPPPRPSIFSNYSFWFTTSLTGMTGVSLHMQWPRTSQLHGSVSQREQLFFLVRIKLHALIRLGVSPPSFDTGARNGVLCGSQPSH
jgi:hypothetical protein